MKKIIISIAGVSVVALAVYAFMQMTNTSDEPLGKMVEVVALNQETPENILDEEGYFNGSLFDLAMKGVSYQCTVTQTVESMTSVGKIYVSSEKVRAEYVVDVPEMGEMKTTMISDETYVYTWNSIMPGGFKTPRVEAMPDNTTPTSGEVSDMNQTMKYKCVPWSPDHSLFTPPSDITFKEMPIVQ